MITDEEFLKYYDSIEEAEKQGCYGCSMKLEEWRQLHPDKYNYQSVYSYGRELREIAIDEKTVYLAFHKFKDKVIITWHKVPDGFEAELGRGDWRQKSWLEYDASGA